MDISSQQTSVLLVSAVVVFVVILIVVSPFLSAGKKLAKKGQLLQGIH
jgi:hypothetical protein